MNSFNQLYTDDLHGFKNISEREFHKTAIPQYFTLKRWNENCPNTRRTNRLVR